MQSASESAARVPPTASSYIYVVATDGQLEKAKDEQRAKECDARCV